MKSGVPGVLLIKVIYTVRSLGIYSSVGWWADWIWPPRKAFGCKPPWRDDILRSVVPLPGYILCLDV